MKEIVVSILNLFVKHNAMKSSVKNVYISSKELSLVDVKVLCKEIDQYHQALNLRKAKIHEQISNEKMMSRELKNSYIKFFPAIYLLDYFEYECLLNASTMGINYLFTKNADTEMELYKSLDNYSIFSVKSHVSYVSEDVDSEPYGDWSEYEISLKFLNLCYMLLSLYPEKTLSESLIDFVDELIILADKQKAEFEQIQSICKARYNALLDASSELERLMFHSFKG